MSIAAFISLSLCWSVLGVQRLVEDGEYRVAALAFSVAGLGSCATIVLFFKPRPLILESSMVIIGTVMSVLGANVIWFTDDPCDHHRFTAFHVMSWKILPALLGLRTLPACLFYVASLLIDVYVLVSVAEVELWLVVATVIYTWLLFGYTAFQQKLLFRLRAVQEHLIAEKATFEWLLRMGFDASFWVANDFETVQGGGDLLNEALGCIAEGSKLSHHMPQDEVGRLHRALRGSVSLDQPVQLLHTTLLRRTPGDAEKVSPPARLPCDLYIVDRRLGLPLKAPEMQLLGIPEDKDGKVLPFKERTTRSASRLLAAGTDWSQLAFFCAIRFLNDRQHQASSGSRGEGTSLTSASDANMHQNWSSFGGHEKTVSFQPSVNHQMSSFQPFEGFPSFGASSGGLVTIQDEKKDASGEKSLATSSWDSSNCLAVGVGCYTKVKEIGRGSQAVVWQVETQLGDIAAMKVTSLSLHIPGPRSLPLQAKATQARLRQVNREARILKSLSWAEGVVVACLDCMVSNDLSNAFLVMEYMPHSLSAVLREREKKEVGPPSSDKVEAWLVQLSAGICAIHSVGAIHRDIKPANILMTSGAKDCKIGDFGVGRWAHHQDDGPDPRVQQMRTEISTAHKVSVFSTAASVATDKTNMTVGIGSWEYAAPEIMQSGTYDKAVDLFGLGCVVFEMLTLEQACELCETDGNTTYEPPIERSRKAAERVQKRFLQMTKTAGLKAALEDHARPPVHVVCEKLLMPNPSERPTAIEVLLDKGFRSRTQQLLQRYPSLSRLFKLSL